MWKSVHRVPRALCVVVLALALPACGGGGGGDGNGGNPPGGNPLDRPPVGDPTEAPAIEFTIPAHAELGVARNVVITVDFAVPIDALSVQPDSIVLEGSNGTVPGTASFAAADIITFVPDDDLPYGDVYLATLRPGVRASSGQQRSGSYTWAFRALEATPRAATLHESEATDMRVYGLELNEVGDGLSLMYETNGSSSGFRFRRVRGGVPTGAVDDIVAVAPGANIPRRTLDVAENGDAQYAWLHQVSGRLSAFIRQFDRGSDSWGALFELTPGAGLTGASVDAEMSNGGGLVSWIENDVGDFDNQRAFAGRYEDGTGLFDVVPLGGVTGRKSGLHLSRRGTAGVVALHANDLGNYRARAARFTQAGGFQSLQALDGANTGFVQAAEASPTGHLYVLFERENPADEDQGRWLLAVANPGEGFGAPMPLHADFVSLGRGAMAVGDNGLLTVLYGVGGSEQGTWVRRYTPGQGLSDPVEMTGAGLSVSALGFDALTVRADADGNAVAAASVASGSGQTIRAALLPVSGPWTLGVELADEPDDAPATRQVKLALEPSGGAFIQWTSRIATTPQLHYLLRGRRLRTDGTQGSLVTYNAAPPEVIASTFVAMTGEGRGLILYSRLGDNAGGPDDVVQALID